MISQICNAPTLKMEQGDLPFDIIYRRFTDLVYKHCVAIKEIALHFQERIPNFTEEPSNFAKKEFSEVFSTLRSTISTGKKLVFVACGKSFRIVSKTVSTYQSLGIPVALLHPVEAMHGDIGIINDGDALILCSHSGETNEVIQLVNYIKEVELAPRSPLIAVSGSASSRLAMVTDHLLLIYQPGRLRERRIQGGLSAPTVSTTLMLVTLDCLGLALTDYGNPLSLHARKTAFEIRHPGGGIGNELRKSPVTPEGSASSGSYNSVVTENEAHFDSVVDYDPSDTTVAFLEKLIFYDYLRFGSNTYPTLYVQRLYKDSKQAGIPLETILTSLADGQTA